MLVISLTGPGQLGKIVFDLRKVTRRGSFKDTTDRYERMYCQLRLEYGSCARCVMERLGEGEFVL